MIAIIVIVVILVLAAVWAVSCYNSFVMTKNRAEEAMSALEAHMKQRYDLIPNLVETVKGYAGHESRTLENVISARNRAMQAGAAGSAREEDILSGTLKSLFALSESYPDLKANAGFLDLQQKLAALEDDILNARKYYNAVVRTMNDRIAVFPSSIIASIFHFRKLSYIEIDEKEEAVPEVRF